MLPDFLLTFGSFFGQDNALVAPVVRVRLAGQKALALQPLQKPRDGGVGEIEAPLDVLRVDDLALSLGQITDDKRLAVLKLEKKLYKMPKSLIKGFLKVKLSFLSLKRKINVMLNYTFLRIIKAIGKWIDIK